jgi:hypothetical protein
MKTAFTTSALNIFPDAKKAFSNFVGSLSTKDSHPVTLKGAVDAKLNLGIFGHLTIPGIGFKAVVPIKGLGGLKNQKYVLAIEMTTGADQKTYLTSILNINNPSQLTLSLGDVNFDSTYNGKHVGISTIKALKLVPGANQILSYSIIDTDNTDGQAFVNGIAVGDVIMGIAGYANSSTNPALNAGLAAVSSGVTIPQNFQGLSLSQAPYKDWSMKISSSRVATITATFQSPYYGIPVEMIASNPEGSGIINQAKCGSGVSPEAVDRPVWKFLNNVKVKLSGTGTTTVTFEAILAKSPLAPVQIKAYNDMINYAKTHGGKFPITIDLQPLVIVNGDGVERSVDWTTIGNNLGQLDLAIGDDFANIFK